MVLHASRRAFYGELRDALGHFPLQHFWGPLANIQSTAWIVDSAVHTPRGDIGRISSTSTCRTSSTPRRNWARTARLRTRPWRNWTRSLGRLIDGLTDAYGPRELRVAGGQRVRHHGGGPRELSESRPAAGRAAAGACGRRIRRCWTSIAARPGPWSTTSSRTCSCATPDPRRIDDIAQRFADEPGIAEVLGGPQRGKYALDHPRAGEIVLISEPLELAGVLLVVRRCPRTGTSPGRSISTASRATTRSNCTSTRDAEHSPGRHAGARFARGARHGQSPRAVVAAGVPAAGGYALPCCDSLG